MARRAFGVATDLYRDRRLAREHLLEIGAHGFETVELVAARAHFDFHNEAAVADLQQWLAEAGVVLHSVRVPPGEDAEGALLVARRIPVGLLVVHGTTPRETARAIDKLAGAAAPLGVRLAIDSASMPPIGSVVHFVEDGVETDVGIALDFGRARRDGDLVDAIEQAAEHLASARVPLDSAIDWASALTTVQKVGYEGPLIFESPVRGPAKETLVRARMLRGKMERWLTST